MRNETFRGIKLTVDSSELALLCLHERKEKTGENLQKIVENLSIIANEGFAFDLGPKWMYAHVAAALAISKNTESIWSVVPNETKERLDFVMEVFVYLTAFGTQRNNNYHTGFSWSGNYSKTWNPNFRLAIYPLIVYTMWYFEGALTSGEVEKKEYINNLLVNFDFDTVIEKARNYGFDKMVRCWTNEPCTLPNGEKAATAKELLENGGYAFIADDQGNIMFAGNGETIKQPYMHRKGGLWYLPKDVIQYCYDGGPCQSKVDVDGDGTFDSYILDHSVSPVEGQEGMFLELTSTGGSSTKLRSSLTYSAIDFELVTLLVAVVMESGWWSGIKNDEIFNKISVGNTDLIYKAQRGYRDVALAGKTDITAESLKVRVPHFWDWVEYWNKYLA